MSEYIIEVQHRSDDEKDGAWYEIDRGSYEYVYNPKNPEKSRLNTITVGYAGRPVRARPL